jgi:DNA (cytosine-5)-methyltransferase 1
LDGFRFPRGYVDVIFGGFPCQDISVAGHGKGLEGERSGLFFEILRLAKEIKPSFIFLENVPAITSRGGLQVVREIAEMGYDCRWCIISAESIGAPHKRERWFLLAHSKSFRLHERGQPCGETQRLSFTRNPIEHDLWNKEPKDKFEMVRMADGIPHRVDRVKALGNAVVPAQCKKAFKILMGLNNEERKKQALFT